MAKRNNKRHKDSNPSETVSGGMVPTFDENALTALTTKIAKGLDSSKSKTIDSEGPKKKKTKRSKGIEDAPDPKSESHLEVQRTSRGVKRDRNGNAKSTSKKQNTKSTRNDAGAEDGRAVLLREILALGGSEQDLDLIADADSGEEEGDESVTVADKSLRKELESFVKGLGLEEQREDDEDEASDLEEAEDIVEEWEDASESDSNISDAPERNREQQRLDPVSNGDQSRKDSSRLIFEARPDWHAASLFDLPQPEESDASSYSEAIKNLKEYAITLLEADSNLYASKHLSSSSSHRFLSTIMSSGTLSDKVSALTLVVQESPVHTTKSFESLLNLAKKRSRGQAVSALGALKDLLGVGVVLPTERRLRPFAAQPGLIGSLQSHHVYNWRKGQKLPGQISQAHLISWAYEDWLKESYFEILKVLEGWCNDEVEYARSRAVTYVFELLKEKPEQEANLLRLLVNKLGDPDKKIASRTSYLLLQLQTTHPLMKPIIIRSIETELLLRPGQSLHAKYYAINTLNQTILSAKEEDIAKKLLSIYFELFVSLLKKPEVAKETGAPTINRKGQIQGGGGQMGKKAKAKKAKEEEAKNSGEESTEKMISAVLTGVNRAFPFSKTDDLTLEKHMDTLFKITHSSNFNTSIQALILIEQLATSKHIAVDRFYRTLYESLLDPRLVNSSKHVLYLNLLFKSLRSDVNIKRVKAFAKRLLQISTLHQPPFICGVLFLLRELEATFPGLRSLYNDPEDFGESNDEVFRDVPEEGEAENIKEAESPVQPENLQVYDGRKRDPEHSNADKSCFWESIPFLVHFHPSVSLFASRLIDGDKMPPKPALTSHTLTSFLDRFVYRNAKTAAKGPRGSSIMQPLAGGDTRGALLSNSDSHTSSQPLNTEAFWRKKAEDVAVDEVFFHKYFSQIGKDKQNAKKKKQDKNDDAEGASDDENEDEIWQALVDSRPEVEGPSDEESDMEMLDLEDNSDEESVAEGADARSDDDREEVEPGDMDFMEDDSDIIGSSDDIGGDDDADTGAVSDDEDLDQLFAKELEQSKGAASSSKKGDETSRQKKRRLKSLPTFAAVEDYADMLDDEDEDNN